MSTTFACPDCGRELRLKPGSTASRVKCPCGTVLDVSDLVAQVDEAAEVVQSPPVKAAAPKQAVAAGAARAGQPSAAAQSEPESVLVIDTSALKEKSNSRVARRDSSPRNGTAKSSPARDDSVARHDRAAARRATSRSGMPILWWAIGGGVVVLALVGMLLVYVTQNREADRLAKEKEKKAQAAKAGLAESQGGTGRKNRPSETDGLAERSPRADDPGAGESVPPKSEQRGGVPATGTTPKSTGPVSKPSDPGTGATGSTPTKPPVKDPALLRLVVTKQSPQPIVMPGGKSFLFCDVQPTRVRVASLESLEETAAVTIPDDFGWGRFLPDGKTLLASGSKGFRTFRTDKGFAAGDAPTSHLNTAGQEVSYELSANGKLLVANRDEFLEPLDTEVLSPKKPRFQRGESRGGAFALSPGGRYVAASDHADAEGGAAATDELHLWNAVTGERHQTIPGRFSFAVFSPDGKKLATYGVPQGAEEEKPGIRLWRTADGAPGGLQVTTQGVRVLAFSPDGLFLLSGGEGSTPKAGRLTLWDLSLGSATHEFKGLGGPVVSASFTPDGARIVCGCAAGEKSVAEVLVFDAAAHYTPGAAIAPAD